MNILFIDNFSIENDDKYKKIRLLYDKFGFYIMKYNRKINFLNINDVKIKNNFHTILLRKYLRYKYKNQKVYVVLSKNIQENMYVKQLIDESIDNSIFVTNQNNLYDNDKLYIDEYIEKNNMRANDVKIILILDKLGNLEKRKLEELIEKYKIVDIYMTNVLDRDVNYINELNNKYGTVIEILDKMPNEYYNIFLVFSNEHKISPKKSSFVLDYNDSDLDVKSNTFLIFRNNIKQFNEIFKFLNMDMSRFEKTKLGKLYIHASGIILDI